MCQANANATANSINSRFLIHASASILVPSTSNFALRINLCTHHLTYARPTTTTACAALEPASYTDTDLLVPDHHLSVRRPWLSSVSTRNSQTSAGKHMACCGGGILSAAPPSLVHPMPTFAADLGFAVIPLHHAQQDPSGTTWYANPAEPSCDTSPCSLTALLSTIADGVFTVVPLASNDHGTCTYSLVAELILSPPHIVPLHVAAPDAHRRNVGRQSIFRRSLLPSHPLSHRLPFQATEGQLHHPHLPSQHQLQR